MKYYEWRAAELFSVLPRVIREMNEEDKAEHIAWAMIRHSEESEIVSHLMQAAMGGALKNG